MIELFEAGTTARLAAQLVGVHRNTAVFYFHRLREIIYYHDEEAGLLEGEIEADENKMFSLGVSLNEEDSMVNAGFSYRFGTGSGNKTSPNNIHELKRRVSDLTQDNQQLAAQLNSSESKLASADAKIQKLEVSLDAESKRSSMLEEKIRHIEQMLKGMQKIKTKPFRC